jgi:tetratricopeptide (TPR) repeat protein
LRFARNYEAASAVLRKAIDLNPARAGNRMQLAFTEITRGNHEEAASELQIAEQLLVPTGLDAFRITQFALGYAQLGRREEIDRLRNELEHVEKESPVDDAVWAMAHIASGDYEQALSRLETAAKERSPKSILALGAIKANAYKDPVLEEDPRFVAVRSRIGTD